MEGRFELRQWIDVKQPAYAVALSGNGQYVACGTEQGVAIFDLMGRQLFAHPPATMPMPVRQVAITRDLGQLYIGTRQGQLIRLDLTREGDRLRAQIRLLYEAPNDLHTLALSADSQLVAVGHLSPGLAMIQADGRRLWRQHPDDATATDGEIWSVAVEEGSQTMYAGSAGMMTNCLLALTVQNGFKRASLRCEARITHVATIAGCKAVVTVQAEDRYNNSLVLYDDRLGGELWARSFNETIMALAVDSEESIVVVGLGYEGEIHLINAKSGKTLAAGFNVKSVITGLAITQGRTLSVVTQEGGLALIRYLE